MALLGRRRWADRAAVNPRGGDGDEETAVEARISRAPGPFTSLLIQLHSRTSIEQACAMGLAVFGHDWPQRSRVKSESVREVSASNRPRRSTEFAVAQSR